MILLISGRLKSTPGPWIPVLVTFLLHIFDVKMQYQQSGIQRSSTLLITQHLRFHQGNPVWGGNPSADTTTSMSSRWRDDLAVGFGDQRLTGRRSHGPTSRFPSSPTPVVITEPFPDRTRSLRHISKEMGLDRNEMCLRRHPDNVTYRWFLPAAWLNSTVVYNVHTLQTKLLLIG